MLVFFFFFLRKALNIILFCLSFLKWILNPIVNLKIFVPNIALFLSIIATNQLRLYLQPYLENAENGIIDIFNLTKDWLNYLISKESFDYFDNKENFLKSLCTVKQTRDTS